MKPAVVRGVAIATLCAWLVAGSGTGHAISNSVVTRLQIAAQAQYSDPTDRMTRYNIVVYRGKAYATTRGTVKGIQTIGVWEYVPTEWHLIFDYPIAEAHTPQISRRFRAYGFSAALQNRLLSRARWFLRP